MTQRLMFALMTGTALITASACSREDPVEPEANANITNDLPEMATPATFTLADGEGAPMGDASLTSDAAGVTVIVNGKGLPAGTHGIHLHEKGMCDGPKFESAGAHWNPGAKKHGRDNPEGAHLGDLANLEVAADGTGTASMPVGGATMDGANGIADADGTSLVIHAKADDYKTDPSGDSGDRIACAVLAPPKS